MLVAILKAPSLSRKTAETGFMKRFLIVKTMQTQSESTATTGSIWKFDPNHTLVEFSGKHMMFTTVKGHFKNVNGTIVLDEADPSRSSVEVEIDASTLYSGVERRDTHLKF